MGGEGKANRKLGAGRGGAKGVKSTDAGNIRTGPLGKNRNNNIVIIMAKSIYY